MAFRTSWGGGPSERWASILVTVAAALATVITCGVLSTTSMVRRVDERAERRSFIPAQSGERPALERHAIFDAAPNGDQIYIYWWRILDPMIRLAGVPDDPGTDSWYVSPALRERMAQEPALAGRFPDAREIGKDGLATATELVAYRMVDREVELSESLSGRTDRTYFLADPADVAALTIVKGSAAVLALPVFGLVVAAVTPTAAMTARRRRLLRALGASRAARLGLAFLSSAFSALPGCAVAAISWWIVSPRLAVIPVVGRKVFVGDLAISVPMVVSAALLIAVLTGVSAIASPERNRSSRPTEAAPVIPRASRLIPLAAGAAMMLLGGGLFGDQSDRTFVAGVLLSSIGGIVALPLVLHRVGDAIAELPGVTAMLVGRRLRWNAHVAARAMFVLGTLSVLTPVAVTWIEMNRGRLQDPASAADVQPVWLNGEIAESERDDLSDRTGTVPLELVTDPNVTPTRTSDAPVLLVGNCTELSKVVELLGCDGDRFSIASDAEPGFARFRTYDGVRPRPLDGVGAKPDGYEVVATMFVGRDWRSADAVLRDYAGNRSEPGPSVGYVEYRLHESPLTKWVVGALTLSAATSVAALALHLVAHSARLAGSRSRLRAVGADSATLARLSSAESSVSVALAGIVSTTIGAAAAWTFVQMNPDARVPAVVLGAMVVAVLVIAALSGAASSLAVRDRGIAGRSWSA